MLKSSLYPKHLQYVQCFSFITTCFVTASREHFLWACPFSKHSILCMLCLQVKAKDTYSVGPSTQSQCCNRLQEAWWQRQSQPLKWCTCSFIQAIENIPITTLNQYQTLRTIFLDVENAIPTFLYIYHYHISFKLSHKMLVFNYNSTARVDKQFSKWTLRVFQHTMPSQIVNISCYTYKNMAFFSLLLKFYTWNQSEFSSCLYPSHFVHPHFTTNSAY